LRNLVGVTRTRAFICDGWSTESEQVEPAGGGERPRFETTIRGAGQRPKTLPSPARKDSGRSQRTDRRRTERRGCRPGERDHLGQVSRRETTSPAR
jgi:hypothetical protein